MIPGVNEQVAPGIVLCAAQGLTIGLLTSIGRTLDAFFVEIVAGWKAAGVRVVTAAGDASIAFPDQRVLTGVTRSPSAVNTSAIRSLRAWVKDEGIDVIIANTATASMLTRLADVGAPVVYFCHGLHWHGTSLRGLPFRAVERVLLRRTRAVICLNRHDESWFERYAPDIPRLRLASGVGLDTSRFSRSMSTRWESGSPIRLLWCGELTSRKNPIALLRLVQELTDRGRAVTVDVLGEGPLRTRLLSLATSRGTVKFHGHTDPIPFLKRAHALVQTSRWEGLPRVALEAVAVGLPTVGFDVKGVQDVPGAYLAPHNDVEALADAVLEAVEQGPRHLPEPAELSFERAAALILEFVQAVMGEPMDAGFRIEGQAEKRGNGQFQAEASLRDPSVCRGDRSR